jgi:peptidoglycan/xylan/chitin deacetylase (PgdA/CDA1 family)
MCKGARLLNWTSNSEWRRRRLAIVCYHGVSLADEHEWDPRFYVSPQTLERRFQMLREGGYNVLPLDEAAGRLADGSLPAKSVVLTFDDGCHDFYRVALPLLRKYRLPSTLYLTTFYCTHPRPVFNMFCYYLLWKGRHSFRGDRLLDLDVAVDLSAEEKRQALGAAIVDSATQRRLTAEEKDALAEELARQLGVTDYREILERRILQLMTAGEVAEAAAGGVDIQLHTHRHRTPLDRRLFVREIRDNRDCIRSMIGETATKHFCYPNGVYAPEFLPWLEEEGVVSATTCESGLASPGDHPLLLPRIIDTMGLSDVEFESWLSGASEWLGRRANKRRAGQAPGAS